jgi:hypothetical protein
VACRSRSQDDTSGLRASQFDPRAPCDPLPGRATIRAPSPDGLANAP